MAVAGHGKDSHAALLSIEYSLTSYPLQVSYFPILHVEYLHRRHIRSRHGEPNSIRAEPLPEHCLPRGAQRYKILAIRRYCTPLPPVRVHLKHNHPKIPLTTHHVYLCTTNCLQIPYLPFDGCSPTHYRTNHSPLSATNQSIPSPTSQITQCRGEAVACPLGAGVQYDAESGCGFKGDSV
jgi:hypothetical protein